MNDSLKCLNFSCSVGSLGVAGSEEFVENVYVRNCTFNGATSATKIKTWPVMLQLGNQRQYYIIRL